MINNSSSEGYWSDRLKFPGGTTAYFDASTNLVNQFNRSEREINQFKADECWVVEATPTSAARPLWKATVWNNRIASATDTGRTVRIPDSVVFNTAGTSSENFPVIIVDEKTGTTLFAGNGCCRPNATSPLYFISDDSGAHAGSGTNGGTVQLFELDNGISHAIGIVLVGNIHFGPGKDGVGFVPPVVKADATWNVPGAADFYGGGTSLCMGSKFLLPREDYELIRSGRLFPYMQFIPRAMRLAEALSVYGAYAVDNQPRYRVPNFSYTGLDGQARNSNETGGWFNVIGMKADLASKTWMEANSRAMVDLMSRLKFSLI